MPIDLKDLARRGAQSRLAELVAEMDSILEAFPDLGRAPARPAGAAGTAGRRKVSEETKRKMRASWARRKAETADTPPAAEPANDEATPRKKRTMSAAARARISAAQKKRWALRKAGKKR
jgi:hypothetical protein